MEPEGFILFLVSSLVELSMLNPENRVATLSVLHWMTGQLGIPTLGRKGSCHGSIIIFKIERN